MLFHCLLKIVLKLISHMDVKEGKLNTRVALHWSSQLLRGGWKSCGFQAGGEYWLVYHLLSAEQRFFTRL